LVRGEKKRILKHGVPVTTEKKKEISLSEGHSGVGLPSFTDTGEGEKERSRSSSRKKEELEERRLPISLTAASRGAICYWLRGGTRHRALFTRSS